MLDDHSHCRGTLSRIDPDTDTVVATIETGCFPLHVAVGGGFVWVEVSVSTRAL